VSHERPLCLADVEESCRLIQSWNGRIDRDRFRADRKTVDTVVPHVVIICEAVKYLSAGSGSGREEVDWRRIAGFRDILIHGYSGGDLSIVWDVVANKIRRLLAAAIDLEQRGTPKR
jgi:uncharacterized protein with HEPN domain